MEVADVREFDDEIPKASYEAKLRQLMRNITSVEVELCSESSKEFIRLLKGNSGRELLHQYVHASSNCSELLHAWKLQQGKSVVSSILSLISAILSHPDGKYTSGDTEIVSVSRKLDKFARLIIIETLEDLYKELNSKEGKRQNAALLLLTSIVMRGTGLASELGSCFDFKLPILPKLAEYKQKQVEKRKKHSTRRSFIFFSMSFLKVGDPRLLRLILTQKEMYANVLRGLGNDEDDIVVYVLSTLKDRVLIGESLVPPSLRSVLFGSVTLDQLVRISGRENAGEAAELAHSVLVLVCTDPCNGLMPDLKRHPTPLKGNPNRLLGLMKKLKATEISYHRDFLLAIVSGRPSFGSAYLDEFPYNIEDHASPSWFSAVSLAANVVSSVASDLPSDFLDSQLDKRTLMKCICLRPFHRSVVNKGLLNSDFLVKHGTLRLLLEALQLLDTFISAIDSNQMIDKWVNLKQEIQNEVRSYLPDPQVLLTLLSSLNSNYRNPQSHLKRKAKIENLPETNKNRPKKLKTNARKEDIDILVSGIISTDDILEEDFGKNELNGRNGENAIEEIWGLPHCSMLYTAPKEAEIYFHSKLLDALKLYLRNVPIVLEGLFDFFKDPLSNVLSLSVHLQQSLLDLLIQYIGWSPRTGNTNRAPQMIYKHLQPFISLLICSPIREVQSQAYTLARAAMLSTGAFDCNSLEIIAWFLFLPGYRRDVTSIEDKGIEEIELFQELSSVVSFLCDAVSTVGNNLFKYWDLVRRKIYQFEGIEDASPSFSPLIICVLEKCLRLLKSASTVFALPAKSIVSLYVCNTLTYLLQTQINAGLLSAVINSVLSVGIDEPSLQVDDESEAFFCEWRPMQNLLLFSHTISNRQLFSLSPSDRIVTGADSSFDQALNEMKQTIRKGDGCELAGVTKAFSSLLLCSSSKLILQNFPPIITISHILSQFPSSILSSLSFLDRSLLADASKVWPEMFFQGLKLATDKGTDRGLYENELIDKTEDYSSSIESPSVAFSFFLKWAPFHVLFPAFVSINSSHLLDWLKSQELLVSKLSGETIDGLVSSLRLVLFWIHQIQSSHRVKRCSELEQMSELCFGVVNHILEQLLIGRSWNISIQFIEEVAETIFSHPLVSAWLTCPFCCDEEFTTVSFAGDSLENFLNLSREYFHKMDYHVLNLLVRTSDHLLALCNGKHSIDKVDNIRIARFVMVYKALLQRLFMEFKGKLKLCTQTGHPKSLVPIFYVLHTLARFVSPFDMLELVHWILFNLSNSPSALSVGFFIAGGAFETLSSYCQQPITTRLLYDAFWEIKDKDFVATQFENVYLQICGCATSLELDSAYFSLLKAINIAYRGKYMQQDSHILPLSIEMLKVISSTPIEIVSHCIYRTNMIKAKLVYVLAEISPLHMSMFGQLFSRILEEKLASNEELLMLLPVALSFLNSAAIKYGNQSSKHFQSITSIYSSILFDGFLNKRIYDCEDIFQVENYDNFSSFSMEELLGFVNDSLLGKALNILRHYFSSNKDSVKMKKRIQVFDAISPHSDRHDKLLDCDVNDISSYSVNELLNLINRVVFNITFSRMLIFPRGNNWDNSSHKNGSSKVDVARIRFINILVSSWHLIAKNFSSTFGNDGKRMGMENFSRLLKFLEDFILRNLFELLTGMPNGIERMDSRHFLEQLMTATLLYRYNDPNTVQILRNIIISLPEVEGFSALGIQLVISHSQFAPTIKSLSRSSSISQFGVVLKPMSSVLRSFVFPSNDRNATGGASLETLEIIKLLSSLFHLHRCGFEPGKDLGINCKDLMSLLLSSYNATLSESDVEIYNLMREIESFDGSEIMAEMDYLWGNAALKIREDLSSDKKVNFEEFECRRSKFREVLPVDPKLCAMTVLYFPFDRTASGQDEFKNKLEVQRYDPSFILRFSIHSLLMGYIEPLEFAGLGLLAVAFVSISSPDDGIRKLGYEALGSFKDCLEKCQKKKTVKRLQLLLTYLQNGIEESWQRIPSVIAIFVAELSFILLDPSHNNYSTMTKLLLQSRRANMKSIPLFHNLFRSSTLNFKGERLWILRLLYAGLNLEDDSRIYIRNSVHESLLSFYSSPLSDKESQELILQLLKKSVKLHKMARYLIEHCGLLSWLSSILAFFSGWTCLGQKKAALARLTIAIEIINEVISSRSITEWLQNFALEQLSELSSHIYKLLVDFMELLEANVDLVKSILQILLSTLKISQKRKIYQPHFTLSVDSLNKLCEAAKVYSNGRYNTSEWALKVVLMSTPQMGIFNLHGEKLWEFVSWAVSTALQSDSSQPFSINLSDEDRKEDSLLSKLLRWITASVIFERVPSISDTLDPTISLETSNLETLVSLFQSIERRHGGDCEEKLADIILYLQQLLGINCKVLPSVVAALHFLLPSNASKFPGSDSFLGHETHGLSLCSMIRCAPEANPGWRWSYYQPWKNLTAELSDLEKLEELHACQSLIVLFSTVLRRKSFNFHVLSIQNVENSGVFKWERSLLEVE